MSFMATVLDPYPHSWWLGSRSCSRSPPAWLAWAAAPPGDLLTIIGLGMITGVSWMQAVLRARQGARAELVAHCLTCA